MPGYYLPWKEPTIFNAILSHLYYIKVDNGVSHLYVIIKEQCSSCGLCADVCPAEAISQIGEYLIDPAACISCGMCRDFCPSNAIEITKD